MILVGEKNKINDKLINNISEELTVSLIDISYILNCNYISQIPVPAAIIINLMDIGPKEQEIYQYLRKCFPEQIFIAIHVFNCETMKNEILKQGYNGYLSIFNLSDELHILLKDLQVI